MACFLLALLLALFLLTSESYQKLTANKKFLFNHVGSITRNTFAYQFNLFGVNKRDKQFDKIFDQIDYKRSATEELPPIEQDPLYPVVKSVVLAGSSRKANGITALRVTHLTEVTRFMIVLEGNSKPQTQAIANAVEVTYRVIDTLLSQWYNRYILNVVFVPLCDIYRIAWKSCLISQKLCANKVTQVVGGFSSTMVSHQYNISHVYVCTLLHFVSMVCMCFIVIRLLLYRLDHGTYYDTSNAQFL